LTASVGDDIEASNLSGDNGVSGSSKDKDVLRPMAGWGVFFLLAVLPGAWNCLAEGPGRLGTL
jgi:hypothetical protein